MIAFKAHSKPVYALAFSPDGNALATSGGDETVRLWALGPVEKREEWPGSRHSAPIAFSPDGRFVGRGGYGACVCPVEGPEGPLIRSNSYAESVCFAPDSSVFVAHGSDDNGLLRWALPSGKALPGGWGGTRRSNEGKAFPTGAAVYHPDGSLLATCFGVLGKRRFDSVFYLWDARSGQLRGQFRADYSSAHPTVARFSPDGSLLAAVYGPLLCVWDVKAEKEVAKRQLGKKHFKGLAFAPDGRRLVTVSNDETVRLWDTATWAEAGAFEWKIGKLGAVDVSPDGFRMAAGGSTGKVVIWDVDG